MNDLRTPLALGMELTALLVVSFYFYKPIALFFEIKPSLMLSILMGLSLLFWTFHAYFVLAKK